MTSFVVVNLEADLPLDSIEILPPSGFQRGMGSNGVQKNAKTADELKNDFFTKTCLLTILNGIWEVWGCPGAWHGPYDAIPSNFGGIWSYMAWGKSIFMFFGNIGNSLHHQIPPNWSSGLQIGPRTFFKARVPSQELSNKLVVPIMLSKY